MGASGAWPRWLARRASWRRPRRKRAHRSVRQDAPMAVALAPPEYHVVASILERWNRRASSRRELHGVVPPLDREGVRRDHIIGLEVERPAAPAERIRPEGAKRVPADQWRAVGRHLPDILGEYA